MSGLGGFIRNAIAAGMPRFSRDSSGNVTLVGAGGGEWLSAKSAAAAQSRDFKSSPKWVVRVDDPSLTVTNSLGTVEAITHPIYGAGVRLTTGTLAGDQAAIDVTGASIGHYSVGDIVSVAMSDTVANTGDTISIRYKNAADLTTGTNNGTFGLQTLVGDDLLTGRMDVDTFAGPVTLPAKMTGVRIRITHTNAGGVPTVANIYGIIKNRTERRGTIIFDFDDGFLSQYTQAWSYMRSRGVVGNVAVIASTVGKTAGQVDAFDYCSLDQLKAMHETGWGMLTHGYYPHIGTFANVYASILADVQANRDYVAANFDTTGAKHYVFPAGQAGSNSNPALSALGFISARTTVAEYQHTPPVMNNFRLRSHQLSAATGLANLKKFYDRCRDSGMTMRLNGHRIVTTPSDTANEISIADFQAFIDYIAPDIQSGRVLNPSLPEWAGFKI